MSLEYAVSVWSLYAKEPKPLDTLTTTGDLDRSSSGRNAWSMRTGPRTLTSETAWTWAAVTSPAAITPPDMPALLISTSNAPPVASATVLEAASTEASSVTSRTKGRAPSSSAVARPRSGSRAAAHTSWPSSIKRRVASRPNPLFAPVMRIVDIGTIIAAEGQNPRLGDYRRSRARVRGCRRGVAIGYCTHVDASASGDAAKAPAPHEHGHSRAKTRTLQ